MRIIALAKKIALFFIISIVCGKSYAQSPRILVPFRLGSKWGYSDTLGNIKIAPKYDTVSLFGYRGFRRRDHVIATAKIKGKMTIIDDAGNVLVPPKYDYVEPVIYLEDFAFSVQRNGKYGLFTKGKELFPPAYDFFRSVIGGHFEVRKNGKYGLIDNKGKLVIPVAYEKLSYEVSKEKPTSLKWAGINSGNAPVFYSVEAAQVYGASDIPPEDVLSEDVFVSPESLTKASGVAKTTYALDSIETRGNAAIVYKNEKQGVLLPAERETVYFFSEPYSIGHIKYFAPAYRSEWNKHSAAYIVAGLGGKYGMINEAGVQVLPFVYDGIEERDGLFLLKKAGKIGLFIWNTIYPVIQPAYDAYLWRDHIPVSADWNFAVFRVRKNGKPGFVGENGVPFFRD